MSGSPAHVMHTLRAVVGREAPHSPSDADLLDRFVRDRDERAFEALVRRYGRVVNGACRRVLRGGPDVEDAWQATFLTLACKAAHIGDVQALAAWLHKVAVRIALRVRADADRRAGHEARAGRRRPDPHPDEVFRDAARADLRAVLDEAIDRLPEKYRAPIVLCYLDGKTNEEAAALLGCPTGTVVTRLARGRDRLRARLARLGVGTSAGLLAAALADLPAGAAPPTTPPDTLARTAAAFAAGRTAVGPVSIRAAILTEGALRAMSTNRLKVLAAALAVCLAGVGPGLLALRAANTDPAPRSPGDPAERGAAKPNEVVEVGADDKAKDKPKDAPKKPTRTKVEEVVTKSFKTGAAPSVALDLFNGSIEVVADAAGSVEARLTKHSSGDSKEQADDGLKNIQLDLTQDKDAIKLTARRVNEDVKERSEGVSAVVKVPPGAVLNLVTSNGSVKLSGGTGKVVVHTKNGTVQVKDATGELDLTSSNGGITATGARGRAKVKTSNGAIVLQAEKGVVTAHTSNGEVQFAGSLADGDHSFTTSNGRIALTLPAATRFKVDATTTNGAISTDFMEVAKKKPGSTTNLKAAVGDNPGVSLTLRATNGAIRIQKEQAETKKP